MPDILGSLSFTWPFYAAALLGYLLGSIPFGLVLARLGGYGDIRQVGSGNIGATNVLRTGNKPLALATLLLDTGKGAAAVLIAARFGPDMAVLAGGGAMLGHTFPVWLKFKGGKGVATALGTLLAIAWPVGLAACLTWLATALLFRYSSLSALVAMALSPVYAWALAQFPVAGTYWSDLQRAELALFIAALVILRHHQNIRRLLKGEEPRIGAKKA
ncbi:MAG: glycerol-3-phosphate 1-O-acyltransferase PlsY [Inquilinus sp.]|nr:glycerol-3-phosphate 1-O-acyltransferase PlsY [Inquilinus sp.]